MFEDSPHIVRSTSFLNGRIQLYQGDSKRLLNDLAQDPDRPPPFVDIVVTDPPYGIKYQGSGKHRAIANDEAPPVWCVEPMAEVLKPNCAMFVCTRYDVYRWWEDEMEQVGLKLKTPIIWDKVNRGQGDTRYNLNHGYETIMIGHKGNCPLRPWTDARWFGGRLVKQDVSIWSIPSLRGGPVKDHPTPKPPELMERALLNHSDPDDLVLDPFMGGAPVAVAAVRQGRQYIGIELEADYFDLAVRNVTKALQDAELDATPTASVRVDMGDDFDWPELEGAAA